MPQGTESSIDVPALINKFASIESKTSELAKYELQSPLSTEEFRNTLKRDSHDVARIAAFLQPYVESLEARVQALEPIYNTIDRFIKLVNGLLRDKSISFEISHGFAIRNKLGTALTAAQLSSGEQQLLLLFCYVLIGREKPSLFMIDEPELSLNVKWQR
jgi:predicted ATPase